MHDKIVQIQEEVKKAIVGKDDVIEKVLIAVLAQGHVLLEDVPGTGKQHLRQHLQRRLAWIISVSSLHRTRCRQILSDFLLMICRQENCSINRARS